jgi:hypothetical protein
MLSLTCTGTFEFDDGVDKAALLAHLAEQLRKLDARSIRISGDAVSFSGGFFRGVNNWNIDSSPASLSAASTNAYSGYWRWKVNPWTRDYRTAVFSCTRTSRYRGAGSAGLCGVASFVLREALDLQDHCKNHCKSCHRKIKLLILWSHPPGSNRRPADYETCNQPPSYSFLVAIGCNSSLKTVLLGGFWMGNWMGKRAESPALRWRFISRITICAGSIHGSLRVTPAMAAWIEDHVWVIDELIGAADA